MKKKLNKTPIFKEKKSREKSRNNYAPTQYHDILINHMCNSLYVTYIDHEMKDVVPSYHVFIDIESRAIFNTAHIIQ